MPTSCSFSSLCTYLTFITTSFDACLFPSSILRKRTKRKQESNDSPSTMPTDLSGNPTECVVDLANQSSGTQAVAGSDLNTSSASLALSGETVSAGNGHVLHVIPEALSGDSSTQLPLVSNAIQGTLEPESSTQPPIVPEQQNSTPAQSVPASQAPAVPTKLRGTYIYSSFLQNLLFQKSRRERTL